MYLCTRSAGRLFLGLARRRCAHARMDELCGNQSAIAARFKRAKALVENESPPRLDDALAILASITSENPKHARAMHLQGVIAELRGLRADAERYFRRSLELRPDLPGM